MSEQNEYGYLQTYSGKRIPVPFHEDVNLERDTQLFLIEDVAHALSNTCRFGGHAHRFYSVAEHSVRVSYLVPPELAMEALLHDMAEYLVGDMPSPLKAFLPEFKNVERILYRRMAAVFGVPPTISPEVKDADREMCMKELPVTLDDPSYGEFSHFLFLPPNGAKRMFLARYNRLLSEDAQPSDKAMEELFGA